MTVENYFQLRADSFDALYDEDRPFYYRVNRILRKAIYERVALTLKEFRGWEEFTVLDVGCGSGRNSVAFANAGAARIVGIDFSERMLEIAREFSRKRGVAAKCQFIKGDFMTHHFDQQFDAVVALGVFDYIQDAESALHRIWAAARYELIVCFPRRSLIRAPLRKLRYAVRGCPVYFYTRRQLEQTCQRLGLNNFQILPCTSAGFLLVVSREDYPSCSRGGVHPHSGQPIHPANAAD
jgi:SAM-dependent methyltransferase